MATSKDAERILSGSADWLPWNSDFQARAKTLNVWDFVRDDDERKESPTPPEDIDEVAVIDRVNDLVRTRQDQQNYQRYYTMVYNNLQVAQKRKVKEYEDQIKGLRELTTWVTTHVSDGYKSNCCLPDEPLHRWYKNLRASAGGDTRRRLDEARQRYLKAIKPLNSPPKDMGKWIDEWEQAMGEGQRVHLASTKTVHYWFGDLEVALAGLGIRWSELYRVQHKDIYDEDSSITYHDVAGDLRGYLYRNPIPTSRGRAKRGVFGPTYEGDDSAGESSATASKSRKRRRDTAVNAKGKAKCRACDKVGHELKDCWFVFPDKAPAGFQVTSQKVYDKVKKAIENDPSIAEERDRINKGKAKEQRISD